MADENMFSGENDSDANEEASINVIETCLQTSCSSDFVWQFICSQINSADPVASKSNNLTLNGLSQKISFSIDICQM